MLDILSRWSRSGYPGSRSFLLAAPHSVPFPSEVQPSMYCLLLRLDTPYAMHGSVVGIAPALMSDMRGLNLLVSDEVARLEREAGN